MREPPPAAGPTPGLAPGPQRDAEAIAALYADTAVYRSPAFRQPYSGLAGVRRYLGENLPAEENIECWFGEPIASGDRAAVEWWGSWREQGQELTFAGVTVLDAYWTLGEWRQRRMSGMPAGPVLSAPDTAVPPSVCIRRVNSVVIAQAGVSGQPAASNTAIGSR